MVEKLTEEVLALPADARVRLAEQLVASLDPLSDDEVRATWAAEAIPLWQSGDDSRRRRRCAGSYPDSPMKHEFHPEAYREYADAVNAYEERQTGLGVRFVRNIELAIESICQAPDRWPILEQDSRRRLTHVFPYAILYTTEPTRAYRRSDATVIRCQAIGTRV
jgi:toxin ParE1/3/4